MVLPKLKGHPNAENTLSDHDSIHAHRNLNYTERSAIARHRNFNAPKICKNTVFRSRSDLFSKAIRIGLWLRHSETLEDASSITEKTIFGKMAPSSVGQLMMTLSVETPCQISSFVINEASSSVSVCLNHNHEGDIKKVIWISHWPVCSLLPLCSSASWTLWAHTLAPETCFLMSAW